jgi:hypothetical protein
MVRHELSWKSVCEQRRLETMPSYILNKVLVTENYADYVLYTLSSVIIPLFKFFFFIFFFHHT